LTAALRPSFWHPCRSTAQWIAPTWLGSAWDLPGIDVAACRGQLGHRFDLHVAVLQLRLDGPARQNNDVRSASGAQMHIKRSTWAINTR